MSAGFLACTRKVLPHMNLADARLKELDSPSLTTEEQALLRCRVAADLIHRGQASGSKWSSCRSPGAGPCCPARRWVVERSFARAALTGSKSASMYKRLFMTVAVLALLGGCSGGRGPGHLPGPGAGRSATPVCESDVRANEYAVYSALLLHKFGDARFVIRDRTDAAPKPPFKYSYEEWFSRHWQRCESLIPASEPVMLEQFREKNKLPRALTRAFSLRDYVLVTDGEVEREMALDSNKPGGGGVNEVYPQAAGVFSLSGVGFDETQTRAVAYVVRAACGRGCGEGFCVLLVRDNCRWRVETAETFWMG